MSMIDTVKQAISRDEKIKLQSGKVYTQSQFQEYDMEFMRTPNVQQRVMFYKKGCNICPKWNKAIRNVNPRLLPKDRIARVEVNSLHPLYHRIQPESAPVVYLDGVRIQGATSAAGQQGFLEGFLEDAIVVQSNNKNFERVKKER